MTYDGRKVMADVAGRNGWKVIAGAHGSNLAGGGEVVAYERHATQILIAWTPENTATWIVKNHGCPDEETATGALGLLSARGWIESTA